MHIFPYQKMYARPVPESVSRQKAHLVHFSNATHYASRVKIQKYIHNEPLNARERSAMIGRLLCFEGLCKNI